MKLLIEKESYIKWSILYGLVTTMILFVYIFFSAYILYKSGVLILGIGGLKNIIGGAILIFCAILIPVTLIWIWAGYSMKRKS